MENPQKKAHKRDPLIPQAILAALALTALVLLYADTLGWAQTPGFLGTYAPMISDINLLAQVALLIVLVAGLAAIKRKHTRTHRNLLTTLVFFSILLTVFIMMGRFLQVYSSGTTGFLQIAHGILGLAAIFCGLYLILLMNDRLPVKWRTKKWKLIMRINWSLFLLVVLGGFAIYWKIYIP
jgi:uncharacterized membrane protein YozB (DUF420 family)